MSSSPRARRVRAVLIAAGLAFAAACAKAETPDTPADPSDRVADPVVASSPTTHVVPYGICAVDWTIVGGAGAESADGTQPDRSPEVRVTTAVTEGDEYVLLPGGDGGDPDDGLAQWQGGVNSGDTRFAGRDGDRAQGGGGGGAASVVLVNGNPFAYAPGGTGAGAGGGDGGATAIYGWNAVVPNPDRDYSGPAGSAEAAGTITADEVPCDPLGPGIPRDVEVAPGVGTLTVSWAPPEHTGPQPIASYEVHAVSRIEEGSVDDDQTCTVEASGNSCVLELSNQFGYKYQVDVSAIDVAGTRGATATTQGWPLTVDYSVPTPEGDPFEVRGLDDAASGGPAHFSASGFEPKSFVRVLLFPGAAELTVLWLDADGAVTGSVPLPLELMTPGEHSLVLWGFAPSDGNPDRFLRADFTVP
jgi:hypothetical protein